MTSIIRSSVAVGAAIVLVTGFTTGAVSGAQSASAAPGSNSSSTSSSAAANDTDPSLAAQQAAGNHAMGSTIPASDPAHPAVSSPLAKSNSLLARGATAAVAQPAGLAGLDVSAYQPSINWSTVAANGAKFAYIKATEGTTYTSSTFASQYNGAYAAGLIRGAYVFATPNTSSGAAQADYFVAHGGGWTDDGRTLPPLLDIEYGYNATCWSLSQPAMVSWISSFSNEVLAKTGIRPAIYSTTDWWTRCTGNSSAFSKNPLFIARYTSAASPTPLPKSWSSYTLWQWADSGTFPGDQDVFNGTTAGLTLLATNGLGTPIPTDPANAGATLTAGSTLASSQSIVSSNKQYTLSMDPTGNLVLRGNGRPIWQTKTTRNPGATATMQTDGNFVVYSAAGKPLWSSGTSGAGPGGSVILQSTGDLQVVTPTGLQWHDSAHGSNSLSAGTQLTAGQFLHDTSGTMQAIMQNNGNFVVYQGGKAKWSSKTAGYNGSHLLLQPDGNLVVYDSKGTARWDTRTNKVGRGTMLVMQADGNLVLYKGTKAVWNSHTVVH